MYIHVVIMTKEGSTKVINFLTHGAGVLMQWLDHISYCSEYALSPTLVIVVKIHYFLLHQYTEH